jgi:type VI secretion system protein ImpE
MATPRELFQAGQLQAAIESLTAEVRANPMDPGRRAFLFELLCFAGQWDRAEKQIDVLSSQGAQAQIGVQVYKGCVAAERERVRLRTEGLQPHFLGEPPPYVDLLLHAHLRAKEGNAKEARELLDRVEEQRPALPGTVNGAPIEDVREADDFLGPILELVVKGEYVWMPFEQIKRVELDEPKRARDLLFTPARIEARDGTVGEVFVPALYARSSEHGDDAVRLGRMTDWIALADDLSRPAGLRTLLFGGHEDLSILEVRTLEIGEPER